MTKRTDFVKERAYIESVARCYREGFSSALRNFNGDPACFVRYCEMQAMQSRKLGLDSIAADIDAVAREVQA